jgi:Na+/melibiose symporter-like transporter
MQKLGFPTKLWFGVGQAAEGIKNAAFAFLLLFLYSQVLGLSAFLAGTALAIALLFDAATDPVAGSLSDSFRHRWGRRHPFMYASAAPLALSFALVFNPPKGLGQMGLFLWLTVFAVCVRGAMTLFHVPHLALGAELSKDYRERTIVVAYRSFFGFLGAGLLFLLSGTIFFRSTPEFENAQMNPEVYPNLGIFFGVVMMVTILASAFGTHSRIPYLQRPPENPEPFSFQRLVRELSEALANPSFRAFFGCLIFFFIARGTEISVGLHIGTYFWQLNPLQVTLIPLCGLAGVMLSVPVWASLSGRLEKKPMFLLGITWFSALTMLLPLAKIWGLFPPQESLSYVPLIFGIAFMAGFGGGAPMTVSGSMLADIADEHELETGLRQEGIFFGAISFASKAAMGVGSALAGIAITLIHFPLRAAPGAVSESTLHALGYVAGPGVAVLAAAGIALMTRYDLDLTRHAEIQTRLSSERNDSSSPPPSSQSPLS